MDLLTAINGILPVLGEHPVTRVDEKHPTLAIIVPAINRALEETLLRRWWFNTTNTTLYPDSEKGVQVPVNIMSFVPEPGVTATLRGRKLYNQGAMTYLWDKPIKGTITERVPFEELPESVAYYVFYYALVTTYLTDIGLEAIVAQWKEMADSAEETATAEHLRNMRYSTRKSPRYSRLRNAMRG